MDPNDDEAKALLARIETEILPLFERAITDPDAEFVNPHLKDCKKQFDCCYTECAVILKGSQSRRCWQEVGTYCGGHAQGGFVEKFGNCKNCPVFNESLPTVVERLGEYFNNMMYLLRSRNQALANSLAQLQELNDRLSTTFAGLNVENVELERQANYDALTGLYNRNRMEATLSSQITHSKNSSYSWSLALLDIDNFKSLNDQYGHPEGDKLLSALGAVIRSNVRGTDCAFRYGGEEFLLILPKTKRATATAVMERIRKEFAKTTILTPQGETSRTISVGVGEITSSDLSGEDILQAVDAALYQAKKGGKNQVVSIVVPSPA